jgi:flavodoxin/ferredoxin
MNLEKSNMGRRKFLVTAGVASTSALALNKLNGLIGPGAANAAETANSKTTGSKCVVIFSSMTGNTEKVGRAIHKALEEAAGSCDIFPIKEANPHKLAGYELIAFGYPVMGPRLKKDVEDFITNMRYVGGKHIILFQTSDAGGNNFGVCVPELKKHGLITIGYKSWHGAVYGPLGDPTPGSGDGHPNKEDLENAALYAKSMWERSKKIYAGDKTQIPAEPSKEAARGSAGFGTAVGAAAATTVAPGGAADAAAGAGGGRGGGPGGAPGAAGGPPGGGAAGAGGGRGEMDPELVGLENDTPEQLKKRIHFSLIYKQDICLYPACHKCQDICPVWGIDFTVEPRIYGDPCMMCAMCDQVCPTGAISVSDEHMKWQRKVEKYGDNIKQVYEAYPYHPKFVVGVGRPYGYDPYTKEDRGPYKGATTTGTKK